MNFENRPLTIGEIMGCGQTSWTFSCVPVEYPDSTPVWPLYYDPDSDRWTCLLLVQVSEAGKVKVVWQLVQRKADVKHLVIQHNIKFNETVHADLIAAVNHELDRHSLPQVTSAT